MSPSDVLTVLAIEYEYQRRLWGYRQSDGTFQPEAHPADTYLQMIRYYLTETQMKLATQPGQDAALLSLKNVTYLVARYLIQQGLSFSDFFDLLDQMEPTTPASNDVVAWLPVFNEIAARRELGYPTPRLTDTLDDVMTCWFKQFLVELVACHANCGIVAADLQQPITNMRDNLPA